MSANTAARVFKHLIAGLLLFSTPSINAQTNRLDVNPGSPVILTATGTNDLVSALQRGLFEEEGNRDYNAAISAYQSLAAQFDRSRLVAATAIFRLGECYRKLGRTNEAVAQYDRIVREFSDQQTLATLSRQNIAGLGAPFVSNAANGGDLIPSNLQNQTLATLESQYALLNAQLIQARATTNYAIFRELFSDAGELSEQLRLELTMSSAQAAILDQARLDTNHVERIQNAERIFKQWEQRLASLKQQIIDYEELRLKSLKVAIEQIRSGQVQILSNTESSSVASDDEEKEIRLIQAMIQNSPDLINAPGSDGDTPLIVAARKDQLRVAEFLLAAKADVNARGRYGETALFAAAASGHNSIVELLLRKKADINARRTYFPAALGGAPLTPLDAAVAKGYTTVVGKLLANKADPNIPGGDGMMPLHRAAQNSATRIAELLLSYNANINAKGRDDQSPLHVAVHNGSVAMISLLLTNNADLNARDTSGDTPLHYAARANNLEVVKLLLGSRPAPNSENVNGALFHALQNPEILAALLDAGGKSDSRLHGNTDTPLIAVASWGSDPNPAVVELLLKRGANPNTTNDWGNTPLHYVMMQGGSRNREVIESLFAHGANPNAQNKAGETPLDLAKQDFNGEKMASTEATALLRSHGASDNVPRFDRIQISRASANFSDPFFVKGTNNWNRFTLLEAIAGEYGLISTQLSGGPWPLSWQYNENQPRLSRSLAFPDFGKVVIHRPASSGTNWTSIPVNVSESLISGRDMPLQWGDVVEIPEADHPVTEQWHRLNDSDMNNLILHVSQTFTISTHGTNASFKLAPKYIEHPPNIWPSDTEASNLVVGGARMTKVSFMVRAVLDESKLLRFSSDLSRVKVTREHDPITGTKREWIFDCSGDKSPDLWLRDGDVIEVPEKP